MIALRIQNSQRVCCTLIIKSHCIARFQLFTACFPGNSQQELVAGTRREFCPIGHNILRIGIVAAGGVGLPFIGIMREKLGNGIGRKQRADKGKGKHRFRLQRHTDLDTNKMMREYKYLHPYYFQVDAQGHEINREDVSGAIDYALGKAKDGFRPQNGGIDLNSERSGDGAPAPVSDLLDEASDVMREFDETLARQHQSATERSPLIQRAFENDEDDILPAPAAARKPLVNKHLENARRWGFGLGQIRNWPNFLNRGHQTGVLAKLWTNHNKADLKLPENFYSKWLNTIGGGVLDVAGAGAGAIGAVLSAMRFGKDVSNQKLGASRMDGFISFNDMLSKASSALSSDF